jgi:hypothetical protein
MSDNSHDQAHEDHTGPVKTPKQMLMLSFASFVIPVFIIIGLVYYVTLANKTAPGGDTERTVAERIQKVGTVEIRDANRPMKAGSRGLQGAMCCLPRRWSRRCSQVCRCRCMGSSHQNGLRGLA